MAVCPQLLWKVRPNKAPCGSRALYRLSSQPDVNCLYQFNPPVSPSRSRPYQPTDNLPGVQITGVTTAGENQSLLRSIALSIANRQLESAVELHVNAILENQRSNPWLREPEGLELRYYVEPLVGEELLSYVSDTLAEVRQYKRKWCKNRVCDGVECRYAHHPVEKRRPIGDYEKLCDYRECPLITLARLEKSRLSGELGLTRCMNLEELRALEIHTAIHLRTAEDHRNWLREFNTRYEGCEYETARPSTLRSSLVDPEDILEVLAVTSASFPEYYYCGAAHDPRELQPSLFNTPGRAVLCPLLASGCRASFCPYSSVFAHSEAELDSSSPVFGTLLRRPGVFSTQLRSGAAILHAQQVFMGVETQSDARRVDSVARDSSLRFEGYVWTYYREPGQLGRFVLAARSPEQEVAHRNAVRARREGFVLHMADPLLRRYRAERPVVENGYLAFLLTKDSILAESGCEFGGWNSHPDLWRQHVNGIDSVAEMRRIKSRDKTAGALWKKSERERLNKMLYEARRVVDQLAGDLNWLQIFPKLPPMYPDMCRQLTELLKVFSNIWTELKLRHVEGAPRWLPLARIIPLLEEAAQESVWKKRWSLKGRQPGDILQPSIRFRCADRVIKDILEFREQQVAALNRSVKTVVGDVGTCVVSDLDKTLRGEVPQPLKTKSTLPNVSSSSSPLSGCNVAFIHTPPSRPAPTAPPSRPCPSPRVHMPAPPAFPAPTRIDWLTPLVTLEPRNGSFRKLTRVLPFDDRDFPPLSLVMTIATADEASLSLYSERKKQLWRRSTWLEPDAWPQCSEPVAALEPLLKRLVFQPPEGGPETLTLNRGHQIRHLTHLVETTLNNPSRQPAAFRALVGDLEFLFREVCRVSNGRPLSWSQRRGAYHVPPWNGTDETQIATELIEKVKLCKCVPV
ncbi:MAG: hypothetical protein KVP17_002833 [Porospora cf. gigantea B]|uniref:uncharacterized protein n=1 Tax=Porospora cf. gigantea B TaxID=2853592 RepID=UPI003571C587|nr:MAG: hypothetical protein KVP17_002833 [Porospora cf. gigantea B]